MGTLYLVGIYLTGFYLVAALCFGTFPFLGDVLVIVNRLRLCEAGEAIYAMLGIALLRGGKFVRPCICNDISLGF